MTENRSYNTKARKYILDFLQSNSDITVAVSDILEYLADRGISVNFTTVYRYLNKLANERKIIKITDESGKAVFQFVGNKNSCSEHIHIECTNCGRLEHIECDFMDHIRTHLFNDHGFDLKCEGSILYGICSACKNKK